MPSYTGSTYIVFGDLPETLVEAIDAVRKVYNPAGVSRWKAHITVKQDEDYMLEPNKLVKVIQQEFTTCQSIICSIKAPKIKKLSEDRYMVYVPVISEELYNFVPSLSKKMEPLIASISEDALQSTLWEQSSDFFAHITVSTNACTLVDAKNIRQIVNEKLQNIVSRIEVSSLSLCKWKKDHWEEVAQIKK